MLLCSFVPTVSLCVSTSPDYLPCAFSLCVVIQSLWGHLFFFTPNHSEVKAFTILFRLCSCSCFLSIQTLHSFSHTPVQNRIHVTVFVVTVSSDLSLSLVLSQFFFYLGLCTHVVTLYKRLIFCLSKLFVVYHSRNTQSAPAAFCCPMYPSTFFLLANDWISTLPSEMGLNHIGYT